MTGANPSERKQIKDEQRQVLRELGAIFTNAPLGILFTRGQVVQRCNPCAASILGYTPDELQGQSCVVVYPNAVDDDALAQAAGPALLAGDPFSMEIQLRRKDGSLIWCQVLTRDVDPGNASAGTVWIFDNIDKGRLTRSELRAIMDNASVGILYSRGRLIISYNPKFADMLRLGEEDLANKAARLIFESDAAYSAFGHAAFPMLSTGQSFQTEMLVRRRDASYFDAEVFGYLIDPGNPQRGTIWIVNDISERKVYQERLKAAIRELESFMTNASVGILLTRDRKMHQHNPKFGEMFGFSGSAAIDQPARVLYRCDEEYANVGRLAAPLLSSARPFQMELFMRHQDGNDLWINLIGYVANPDDAAKGTIWIIEDRTDYKRAEDALRESHAELEQRVVDRTSELEAVTTRLLDFAEAASDWFWEMGPDLRFSYFSKRINRTLGIDHNTLIGKSRREIMAAEDIDAKWARHLDDLDQARPFRDFEYRIALPNGSFREISISGKPIFDAGGMFLGYRGIGGDISDRKRTEREIANKSAVLQATLDNMSQGISVVDRDLRMSALNRKFCELLDFPEELAMQGAHFSEFARYNAMRGEYGPCDVEEKVRELTALARNPKSHQFRRRRPNGRIIEVAGNPMPDGGFVTTYTDVTEQEAAGIALRISEQRYRALTELSPAAILMMQERQIVFANETAVRLFGVSSPEQLIGRSVIDFVAPEFREKVIQRNIDIETSVDPNPRLPWLEMQLLRGDGERVTVEASAVRTELDEGRSVLSVIRDISDRIAAEQNLRVAATTFESQEGMVITDANEVILRVNNAFTEITGYSADEAVGHTPRLLKSGRHDLAFFRDMWASIEATGIWRGEVWNRRKDGEVYPQSQSITAVRRDDGIITHFVGTFTDITHRKQAEDEIRDLAFYDPLTHLPNRRLLIDRLRHALSGIDRDRCAGALMFIDLDNFKVLNDTRGHDSGDMLLVAVAQRLQEAVRQHDTVARLGGDEFVVMLESLDTDDMLAAHAEAVATKVLVAINRPYRLTESPARPIARQAEGPAAISTVNGENAYDYRCSASIGITLFRDAAQTVDEILKQADLAMYQAKAAGRNTLRFFDPEMQARAISRAALEDDLRRGVLDGQFLTHYQPQIGAGGKLNGVEALLRWRHPTRGLVLPAEFIPLAEETGLILPLGFQVLKAACEQLVAWSDRADRDHLTIAVNVSAMQLNHDDFVDQVCALLDHTGADSRRLKLELTESLLMQDPTATILKMIDLKARGVGFSLDDFGTSYSSLAYLKRLPLEQLKIDRSFISDLPADQSDAVICRTIVALGQSLGFEIIAEGVESRDQLVFLNGIGCENIQGFLVSKPLPIAQLESFIDSYQPIRI